MKDFVQVRFILFLGIWLLASCQPQTQTPQVGFVAYQETLERKVLYFDITNQVKALQTRDAVADAETAFRGNDKRPFSLRSLDLSIPELPEEMAAQERELLLKSKIIIGTSDYRKTSIESELNTAAEAYASRYNKRLFELIGGKGK